MTAYDHYFEYGGALRREADIRISSYLIRPDALDKLDRIGYYDRAAAQLIASCNALAAALAEYRADLARRYGELAAAPRVRFVRLKRYKQYDNHVTYTLDIGSRLLDGTGEDVTTTKYPGTQRAKAIADYKALLKKYPGITAELDIAKSKWER